MAGQHTENLFRRFKGEIITVRTVSGTVYEGRVVEITNDYVCLNETSGTDRQVFLFFRAIESTTTPGSSNNPFKV